MDIDNERLRKIIKGMIYGFILGEHYGLQNKYKVKSNNLNLDFTNYDTLQYYSRHVLLTLDTMLQSKSVNYSTEGLDDNDFKYFVDNLKKMELQVNTDNTYMKEIINHPDYDTNQINTSVSTYYKYERNAAFVNPLARTVPLSLLYFTSNLQTQHITPELFNNVAILCRITHYDTRCIISCIIYSIVLQRIIAGVLINNSLLSNVKIYCFNVVNLIMRVRTADDYPNNYNYPIFMDELLKYFNCHIADLKLTEINDYIYKTLGCILWAVDILETFNKNKRGELNFEKIMRIVLNECGHSDINTAVIGSIVGAFIGYDNLPITWLNRVPDKKIIDDKLDKLFAQMQITT